MLNVQQQIAEKRKYPPDINADLTYTKFDDKSCIPGSVRISVIQAFFLSQNKSFPGILFVTLDTKSSSFTL
jgi:hypothetical protein